MVGWLAATLAGRSQQEITAISIETGLQNTGLAIGLLKVSHSHIHIDGAEVVVASIESERLKTLQGQWVKY